MNITKARISELISRLNRDDVWTMSAALSFYMASAIVPLFLLLASCLAYFNFALNQQLLTEIRSIVGDDAGNLFLLVLNSMRSGLEIKTALVGIVSLAITSSVIFAQLQTGFSKIFIKQKPPRVGQSFLAAVISFLKNRVIALTMMTAFVILIMALLYLSVRYNAIVDQQDPLGRVFGFLGGLAGFTLIFALIFKTLARVSVRFSHCMASGFLTALIFMMGKSAIGFYVKAFAVSSTYGAAGFPIALFFWLYYTSVAIFLGAETLGLSVERPRAI